MEFPNLGQRCSEPTCNTLDFLPLTCVACKQTFCRDHFGIGKHTCAGFSEPPPPPAMTGPARLPCPVASCPNFVLVHPRCSLCDHSFCLNHRYPEAHDCAKLVRPGAAGTMPKTKALVDQLVAGSQARRAEASGQAGPSGAGQTGSFGRGFVNWGWHGRGRGRGRGRGNSVNERFQKMNEIKLKMQAQGDKSLPLEERVYFFVTLPTVGEEEKKPFPVYLSKHWSVGKGIDVIAEMAGVENKNNVPTADKLRLFVDDPEATEFLPLHKKWSEVIEEGVVASGGYLVLDYVPA